MDHSELKNLVNREKEDGSASVLALKTNVIRKSPLSLSTSQSSSSTVAPTKTESSSSSIESSSSLVIEESGNERYKKRREI